MNSAAAPDIDSVQAMLYARIRAMREAGVNDFSGLSFTDDRGVPYWERYLSDEEMRAIFHKMAVAGLLGSDGRPDAGKLFRIAMTLEAEPDLPLIVST